MRILKVFRLAAAVWFGAAAASAQVSVRLSVPAVPVALPALAAPVVPFAGASLSAAAPASLALTPALAPVSAAPAAASPQILFPGGFHPGTLLNTPAAAEPVEAVDYGKLFDGAAMAQDGAAIRPRLVDPNAGETIRLPLQLGIVRGEVERALPALRESVALGSWNGPNTTLSESCCGDAAPKLAAVLRARGLPTRLVEAEFHYYVILDLPESQILIDPTIRQFFGKKNAPRGIPDVFVGTLGDLSSLFERYKAAKTTRYDTGRIYFSEAVSREERLVAVGDDLLRNGARDLAPLRRFLGLPSLTPPPPLPPRLIIP